eukprot:TRINITY_DN2942_c0_g1_i1.p1 TRINITY_DN2942_c0_g1~~TRINITY_DN2942_c0_g1_i1.p1  ORF type:complete len:335 (+),score=56.43 TRINITY_DN2942_c0_g1_i1:138-1142(+)
MWGLGACRTAAIFVATLAAASAPDVGDASAEPAIVLMQKRADYTIRGSSVLLVARPADRESSADGDSAQCCDRSSGFFQRHVLRWWVSTSIDGHVGGGGLEENLDDLDNLDNVSLTSDDLDLPRQHIDSRHPHPPVVDGSDLPLPQAVVACALTTVAVTIWDSIWLIPSIAVAHWHRRLGLYVTGMPVAFALMLAIRGAGKMLHNQTGIPVQFILSAFGPTVLCCVAMASCYEWMTKAHPVDEEDCKAPPRFAQFAVMCAAAAMDNVALDMWLIVEADFAPIAVGLGCILAAAITASVATAGSSVPRVARTLESVPFFMIIGTVALISVLNFVL